MHFVMFYFFNLEEAKWFSDVSINEDEVLKEISRKPRQMNINL